MNLNSLKPELKLLVKSLVITLTFGMILGLIFVAMRTSIEASEIANYYHGTVSEDEFATAHGKTLIELLLTTHNHIISFTFIFTIIGFLISISSIKQVLKKILILEPFISIIVTFSMMFFIKYVHPNFVYLMILSSTLMYLTYFFSVFLILRDLKK